MAVTLTINFANMDKCALVEDMLNAMGIKYGKKEVEMPKSAEKKAISEAKKAAQAEAERTGSNVTISVPVNKGYTEVSATPKKESAPKKPEAKVKDGFDRALYEELSKHFGVATKKSCARFARQTIYDAMSTVQKSKKGTLTKTAEKAIWKQLMTEAARFGEAWAIAMVEQAYAEAQ